jgi:hypothetical protein
MSSLNPELVTIIISVIVVVLFEGSKFYFKKNKISNEVVEKNVLEISQVVNIFATLLKGVVPNDVVLITNVLNAVEQGLGLLKDASNPQVNDAQTTKEAIGQILNANNVVVSDDVKNAVNAGVDLAVSKIKEVEGGVNTPVAPITLDSLASVNGTIIKSEPQENKVESNNNGITSNETSVNNAQVQTENNITQQ